MELKTHGGFVNLWLVRVAQSYLFIFAAVAVAASLGWFATDYNVLSEELSHAGPSWSYWFGNDVFGRSILSRGWHAGFTALVIGLTSAFIAVSIGGVLGVVAGYFGGWVNQVITLLFVTLESIPYIFILAALAFVLGQGFHNVYISIGLTSWVLVCRLVRAECLRIKSMDYVLAAQAYGMKDGAILWKHILPQLKMILWSQFLVVFVFAIKVEVLLTFLGLGVEPGYPSWGYMFDEARQEVTGGFWWSFLCATLMMSSVVLALQSLVYYYSEENE